jgi:hypothetical protein
MRRALLETLREGRSAARSQARGVDGRSGRWTVLLGCCLATIALYVLVALVVLPDVTPSGSSRLLALMVTGSASLVAVGVARWAPRLVAGSGTVAGRVRHWRQCFALWSPIGSSRACRWAAHLAWPRGRLWSRWS